MAVTTTSIIEATRERDEEAAQIPVILKPGTTVTYLAARRSLRLVKVARYTRRDAEGRAVGESKGVFVSFTGGALQLPKTGPVRLTDTLNGGSTEIEDVTEIHEWMRKHDMFGDRTQGFWEAELPTPAVTQDEMDRIIAATLDIDVADLEAIVAEEEAGWGREVVINAVHKALAGIEKMKEQAAANGVSIEPPAAG